MASIAKPTRSPRANSLGIQPGITNMDRMNRKTKLIRMTRLPIPPRLGRLGEIPGMLPRIGRLVFLGGIG